MKTITIITLITLLMLFSQCKKEEQMSSLAEMTSVPDDMGIASQSLAMTDETCGTDLQQQLAEDSILAKNYPAIEQQAIDYVMMNRVTGGQRAVVTIPVVVHIVLQQPSQITDAQVAQQLQTTNDDFHRTGPLAGTTVAAFQSVAAAIDIDFCLHSIIRKTTNVSGFSTSNNVKSSSTGGSNPLNTSKYLNVWVCNMTGGSNGTGSFPGGNPATQGIVVDDGVWGFGSGSGANGWRVLTHECGHWLNMHHIWNGGCSATGTSGDGCPDTPTQSNSHSGCNLSQQDCGHLTMTQNFMDYTSSTCKCIFTIDQRARAMALFQPGGARRSFVDNPETCGTQPPPPGNHPPTSNITSPVNGATFTAPASVTITATATDDDGSIVRVEFYSGSALIGTDNSAPYSFTWNNVTAGNYAITARAYDNLNATGTSAVVNISVGDVPPPPPPTGIVIKYSVNANRSGASVITNGLQLAPATYYIFVDDAAVAAPVTWMLTGAAIRTWTESQLPYDLYGGSVSTANGHLFTAGTYALSISSSSGQASITFTVSGTPPPPPQGFHIKFSETSSRADWEVLHDGEIFDKTINGSAPREYYYVFVDELLPTPVVFTLRKNGNVIHTLTENVLPYDLFGGTSSTARSYIWTVGDYVVTVTPAGGQPVSVNFSVE